MASIESLDGLMEVTRGFRRARIILSAVEADIFNTIGSGKLSAKQVTENGELDPRAVGIILDALTAMGLLLKDEDSYSLSEIASEYLNKESEAYIGATMLHHANLWQNWSNLTNIVRGEVTDWMMRSPLLSDPVLNRSFILCMHDLHYPEALRMVQFLELKDVKHMVDIGGGAGSYSIAFVNSTRGLHATIIDLPQTIEVAKEIVADFGLADRIECKVGDVFNDLMLPFGNDVDLFFVSSVIHQEGYEENARLMKRLYNNLVPGGRVVINDVVVDETRTHPEEGALFSVNMLVGTERGRTYTHDEIESLLTNAGFEVSFEHDLAFGKKAESPRRNK